MTGWLTDRYYLTETIGKGGFGTVYKAFDALLNCYVAIKEFPAEERFSYEAGIMKALRNVPYISRYKDSFQVEGKTYIVMKLLKGQSLQSVLNSKKKILAKDLMIPLENLLTGIEKMHELGFIHRDISPGNLFYTEDGELILIDFGTATSLDPYSKEFNKTKFEHRGFQAPENDDISKQGPWTDIYSFCSTVFYILTGEGVREPDNRKIMDNVPTALLRSSLTAKQQNGLIQGLNLDTDKRCKSAKLLKNLLFGEDKNTFLPDKVLYSAATFIGSKKVNQDNLLVDNLFYFEGRDFIKSGAIDCVEDELHIAAVCDGVGGANSGELASRAVVQALKHFVEQQRFDNRLPERLVEELLDQINEKIISLGKKIGRTGTTVSFLLWTKNQYYIVNVGDSPVFLLRNRKLKKMSVDQTLAYVKEAEGEIPSRKDLHTLANYMGKPNIAGSQMMWYRHGYLRQGDVFLLCTDGVSNKIDSGKLKRLMGKPEAYAMEKILKLLKKEQKNDNCSAVIIKF